MAKCINCGGTNLILLQGKDYACKNCYYSSIWDEVFPMNEFKSKYKEFVYRQDYESSEMIKIKNTAGTDILVCPQCKDHIQGEPGKVHDCKNLYIITRAPDGRIAHQGQCCCYSEAHGRRD